ncbi:hypothetical protein AVEN_34797-1 [Araneus ventricosus]|uniref:Uncharacterized protein n=1 Tax=Araneus ventricosus TaxID=182803 RepID=A0A4Y2PKS0_ARAVE|nr:hypothetical protein AVEN_34797-1 [Araneus ventricosus]
MESGEKRELKKETEIQSGLDGVVCIHMQHRWPSDLSHLPRKLAYNKKSNLEIHFTTKHKQFAGKYPTSDARKKAVEELQKSNNSQVPCLVTGRNLTIM